MCLDIMFLINSGASIYLVLPCDMMKLNNMIAIHIK